MNRYPLWKYITVAIALVLGFIYTLPNFFGESPAVQVSSAKATLKVDQKTLARVEEALKGAGIVHDGIQLDFNGVKTRLHDTDTQLKAKDILEKTFNPDPADPQYVVALNLLGSAERNSSSSASTIGERPRLTRSTRRASISRATTSLRGARIAAFASPTYPSPATAIFIGPP